MAGCLPSASKPTPAPTSTALPTATSTSLPEPTRTVTPTAPPSPTAQPTPQPEAEPTVAAPDQDVLTVDQKQRLYQAAMAYEADTEAEAIRVAQGLAYVQGDGHPASMCGPLAAAILRDAGLLSPYIDLHEFWLLNPRDHLDTLEKVFPPDRFEWQRFTESIQTFDFKAFPLKAGDFLYLYAGDPGSFEHMLTVSRVDEQGRAYSVTNYETETGFYIGERMLYDPNDPGVGQFYIWTDRKYAKIGLTGFGGFLLLRFAVPVVPPDPQAAELARQIDQVLAEAGGEWKISIKEIDGAELYSRRSLDRVHVASVIKLPIAILFFKSLEADGLTDIAKELEKGTAGRSYQQLLRAMLVDSEEDATDILLNEIRLNHVDVQKTLAGWGLGGIDLDLRRSTVYTLVQMAEKLYLGKLLGKEANEMLLTLLETYTPNDDLRLGVIRKLLPAGYHFYNKRGTITQGLLVVADLAFLTLPTPGGDRAYCLGVFGYQGLQATTYEKLDAAIARIARVFWDFTQATPLSLGRWRRQA